ncbi:hypothetical protein CLOM_g16469 [Closterium sp. NIES-68]|nr:hypothetical protein CLOM_g16469 [Closterium sp. NIES-68]GJP58204.1 hypothetical protein CLOP_g22675 [Closterium sp. NIES-67]
MGKGGSLSFNAQAKAAPSSIAALEIDPNLMCERPRILSVLAAIFDQIVERNEANQAKDGEEKLTVFHGLRAPAIGIDKYMERIFKYANCSPACFVLAYIYVEKMVERHDDMVVTSLNVHRLLITSVMVAAKFLDDSYFNNAYYAKVGGVTTAEMNRLEMELLFRMDFRMNVTTDVFFAYCKKLETELWQPEVDFNAASIIDMPALTMFKGAHGNVARTHPYECQAEYEKGVRTPPREMESYRYPGVTARVLPESP